MPAWIRSALTTAIAVLGGLVAFSAVPGISIPAEWIAIATAVLAGLRTVLAALDPGQPLYGIGSQTEGD